MNKFSWISKLYLDNESFVIRQDGVSILDGNIKSTFTNGSIELTTHRLIWFDTRDPAYRIAMHLKCVKSFKVEKGSFGKPNCITICIFDVTSNFQEGIDNPVSNSNNSSVRFVFKKSGDTDFLISLTETINARFWNAQQSINSRGKGILGIERNMKIRSDNTDQSINMAFCDLDKLMTKAKDMVTLCNSISQKIANKGDLTTDETVQFKAYLLSMGISDPVTRNQCVNFQAYSDKLAKQISEFLIKILPSSGNVMSTAEAFCRINRARGMELLSPEDMIEAGRAMNKLKLPVVLKTFDSGVMVFQLASLSEEDSIYETISLVKKFENLTSEKLSRILLIPTLLSKERLLLCENKGMLCRDDTVEGLKFYINKFI